MSLPSFLATRAITALCALLLLGGCVTANSDKTNFFILTPINKMESGKPSKFKRNITVTVNLIELPLYLQQTNILTRRGDNSVEPSDFNYWAEPLRDNFSDVLGKNLSILLPTGHIFVFPKKGTRPADYQVAVEVIRFDGKLDGEVVLDMLWAVSKRDEQELSPMKKSSFSDTVNGKSYEALVSSMNRVLNNFSSEIATAIESYLE